jgi:hypothetical protein
MNSSPKINTQDRPRNREVGRAVAAMEDRETKAKPKIVKQGQNRWHAFRDKWFRTADGEIVVAQTPNAFLLAFIIIGFFAVVSYHGIWHTIAQILALAAILFWAVLEIRSGVNRFRRLLGKIALACVAIVLILYFWK